MKSKRPLTLLAILLLLTAAASLAWRYYFSPGTHRAPLAPNAPEAPAVSLSPGVPRDQPTTPSKYNWPPDFKLPLVIHIDTPPVPKEIQGRTPEPNEKAAKDKSR